MRTRATLSGLTSSAAPIAASVQPGPASPWLAFNRIRAWVRALAGATPRPIMVCSRARSCSARTTMGRLRTSASCGGGFPGPHEHETEPHIPQITTDKPLALTRAFVERWVPPDGRDRRRRGSSGRRALPCLTNGAFFRRTSPGGTRRLIVSLTSSGARDSEGGANGRRDAAVGQVFLDAVGPVLGVVGDDLGQPVAPVVTQRAADGDRVRWAPGVQPAADPVRTARA